MRVSELNRQQLIELKQNYLTQLDNEGTLEEVAGIKSLGWSDLVNADSIVTDDVIFENYVNTEFSEEDFTSKPEYDIERWSDLERAEVFLEKVDCDDTGDPEWQWHVYWRLDGRPLWNDYFRTAPDQTTCYNTLVKAVRGGYITIKERAEGD